MSNRNAFSRVFSMWFDHELTNDDKVNSLCVLGELYRTTESTDWPPDFLQDVYSRIWITYRTGFTPIPKAQNGPSPLFLSSLLRTNLSDLNLNPNEFTSDVGWGCMIRTSQSLLANTLQAVLLGKGFRYGFSSEPASKELSTNQDPTQQQIQLHNTLIDWFNDTPDSYFSLHNFVRISTEHCNKRPGEWFGPNAASQSIKYLCEEFSEKDSFHSPLNVIISETGDIYDDEVSSSLQERSESKPRPTLILFAIRLGIENINPIYYSSLLQLLSLTQSMGIAGGRPSSSHYFFGYQGDYLFYLDPHQPQHSSSSKQSNNSDIQENVKDDSSDAKYDSYHTRKIRKLNLKEMDPSMLVGFLIQSTDDYEQFKHDLSNMSEPAPSPTTNDDHDKSEEELRHNENLQDVEQEKKFIIRPNRIVHFHNSRSELSTSCYLGNRDGRRNSDFENIPCYNSEVDNSEEFVDDFNQEDDDFVDLGLEFKYLRSSQISSGKPEMNEKKVNILNQGKDTKHENNFREKDTSTILDESNESSIIHAEERFTKIDEVYEEPILVSYELHKNVQRSNSESEGSKFEDLSFEGSDKIEFQKEKTKTE